MANRTSKVIISPPKPRSSLVHGHGTLWLSNKHHCIVSGAFLLTITGDWRCFDYVPREGTAKMPNGDTVDIQGTVKLQVQLKHSDHNCKPNVIHAFVVEDLKEADLIVAGPDVWAPWWTGKSMPTAHDDSF